MMDPISAFSLACNVLQVIELGHRVLSNTVNYHRATNGELSEQQDLRTVAQRLNSLDVDLQESLPSPDSKANLTPAEAHLMQANGECMRLSSDFIEFLDRLKLRNPHAVLESVRASMNAIWYREKLETMQRAVTQARDNLNMAIWHFCTTQATAAGQYEILQSTAQVEGTILTATEALSQPIRRDIVQLSQQVQNNGSSYAGQFSEFLSSHGQRLDTLGNQLSSVMGQQDTIKALEEKQDLLDTQQKIIASLRFPQLQERAQQIPKAHKQTYKWVLRPHVQTWDDPTAWISSDDKTRSIYWISGKPGSGKSTLMRFLEENLDVQKHMLPWANGCTVVRASHFFWSSGNLLQKSLTGLLRSLLLQSIDQMPDLIPQVIDDRRWRASRMSLEQTADWSDSELLLSLERCISASRDAFRILFFVDGLDELEGTDEMRLDLTEMLSRIGSSGTVKICVSSRPWNLFRDYFSDDPKLRLEDLTHEDISIYVQSQFLARPRFKYLLRRDEMGAGQLVAAVTRKAAGDGDSIKTLYQKLEDLPADLNDYFTRLISTVDVQHRREASIMLQIALHEEDGFVSLHALRLFDLVFTDEKRADFALGNPSKFQDIALDDHEGLQFCLDSTMRRLNSRCMGLLECIYAPDDVFDMFDIDPMEAGDETMYSHGMKFEPSMYSAIFQGPGSIRPFMLTVDFLHRCCRDFLLSPEIQTLLFEYTEGPYDARMFLRFKQLDLTVVSRSAWQAISLVHLPYLTGENQQHAPEPQVYYNRPLKKWFSRPIEDGSSNGWYINPVRVSWNEEKSSFLTLAIDFDLRGYITAHLTAAIKFSNAEREFQIGNSMPNIDLLHRVLDFGADPNALYCGVSIWALFLSSVDDWLRKDVDTSIGNKKVYLKVPRILIDRDATLVLPKHWLLGEGLCRFGYFTRFSSDRKDIQGTDRWPEDLPLVDGRCYAVADLLEAFRALGPEIDELIALVRTKMNDTWNEHPASDMEL
ncbi:hypothetical protein BO71DRAFT_482045 [Aspergillus ellipticus CBS 707.79]|uniref:Uncharacterized protein n=1 Tax=Aspergillus ellipticus CBS 707.79 TaxID=1448320 RepID=A0A319EXK4_9EURO|nr:hypothetical protein BO71DRAFT_482045 [Aspergillus ellipticus CBS 707.79]